MTPVAVSSYADLISDDELSVSTADAVAMALTSDVEFVAWVPEWLAEDKAAIASPHHEQVVAGMVEHETEKAFLISRDDGEEWVPKSAIRRFEATEDAEIQTPQKGFDSFEEGSA